MSTAAGPSVESTSSSHQPALHTVYEAASTLFPPTLFIGSPILCYLPLPIRIHHRVPPRYTIHYLQVGQGGD